jgi:hypothetical protein
VLAQPDDPASQAIEQIARGLIAMTPLALPILPLVQADGGEGAPSPGTAQAERKPAGMSLPMA